MTGLWHHYWAWTGGNVGAMPLQAAITVAGTLLLRRPLAAWWHRHFGARAELAELKATADAAHRIVADLFEHHAGRAHDLAPGSDRES